MEEKLKDIFTNVKERLSNPLVFSFIISWVVYNWKVTIALFWYDKTQIQAEGCKSIFEFIQHQIDSNCCSNIFPLGLALLYTFGMPYFKELIDLMNKKAVVFGNNLKAKILKDGLLIEIGRLKKQLDLINDTSLLEGNWRVTKYFDERSPTGGVVQKSDELQIYISNRDYYIVENDLKKRYYHISDFFFNPLSNDMLFKLKSYGTKGNGDAIYVEKDIICSLKLDNGYWNNLSGTQNDIRVEYRKL